MDSGEGSRKPRKHNFSASEISILTEKVEENLAILQSKFTNSVTNLKKKQVWSEITAAVNAVGVDKRTETEVREKWKNLHSAAKREFTKFRQESKKTGGGPAPKEISATTSKVIELFQDTPSFIGLSGFETNCPNDQSVEEQSSGWSDVIVVSEVSEQPQSATAVSAEDVEQEKRCIVVQESEGKFKPKRKKITHDLVLEQQFNTLLLKQENLKLKKRKLELEVLLLEERVKRETVVGQTMQPLTTINASPIFTNHFE
ncbi:t-SNARE domain-containing protein 1 [Acropora cervicornis]|uniref:t-SNARE domain-containing protein 1 n=1 Tax=Acropora cervicornis TaxID=6130 RepID=A0AAD9QV87_ACRCE|nr:t-SNARE domain-containing protein 1 [Acropora cervicornis]